MANKELFSLSFKKTLCYFLIVIGCLLFFFGIVGIAVTISSFSELAESERSTFLFGSLIPIILCIGIALLLILPARKSIKKNQARLAELQNLRLVELQNKSRQKKHKTELTQQTLQTQITTQQHINNACVDEKRQKEDMVKKEPQPSPSDTAHAVSVGMKYCTHCGKPNQNDSRFCGFCGHSFTNSECAPSASSMNKEEIDLAYYKANLQMQQQQLIMQQQALEIQQKELEETQRYAEQHKRELRLQKQQFDSMMKCPLCGSTSLSGNKKGYGIGKGLIGAAVFGPIGLVAGNLGSKKVIVTCMKCGYKFKA